MLKHKQLILEKIENVTRTNGIPDYTKHWKPPKSITQLSTGFEEHKFIEYLQKTVKSYHPHASVMVNQTISVNHSTSKHTQKHTQKKHTNIASPINHKRGPTLNYDARLNIGTITYYEYYLDFDDKYDKDPKFISLVSTVRETLNEWVANGMKGLIIDLRQHTGGWYIPFVSSLHNILNGSTLFGWDNSSITPNDPKWISYINGKIRYQTKLITKSDDTPHPNWKSGWNIPIAIIIGSKTYSSGEFCASIFYRGNPNIRVFGEKTGGGLSVNQTFKINKLIQINIPTQLTTTVDGSFHTEQYLMPDINTGRPITDAKKWILQHKIK
jgi:C-terminal processing protease CtpA/Prc